RPSNKGGTPVRPCEDNAVGRMISGSKFEGEHAADKAVEQGRYSGTALRGQRSRTHDIRKQVRRRACDGQGRRTRTVPRYGLARTTQSDA
ncbi:MAG: hypothetical protein SPD11_08640, partial [Sphaerochaetaceae bacterium]|nr:hypothetical protein [Sphaerochaetaceae bacterium]